ncbi:MAG: hypothetical protein J6T10_19270 [Methanobrevibacter sp.]|nr:hypothetical protein [Methanobrevibacter sp.]
MNYNELKEIVTRHGFVLDKYDGNCYNSNEHLYIHANNTMFDDTGCNDVLATVIFGKAKLIRILWFDKLSVSKKSLFFEEVKKGEDYDSKDLVQKIETRFGLIQNNIKKAIVKLKLKEINKDFVNKNSHKNKV